MTEELSILVAEMARLRKRAIADKFGGSLRAYVRARRLLPADGLWYRRCREFEWLQNMYPVRGRSLLVDFSDEAVRGRIMKDTSGMPPY